ncbi:MAG: flagellar assembly protein FliX [Rhodospirillaceae bacterium]|nr:flagellar assembly protein FliX [Rhodospirillaceae bacterium]
MKVDGPKTVGPGGSIEKKRRSGGSGFADQLSELERSEETGGPAAVSAPRTVDALWALQEVDDATTGRRRAVARAEDLLAGLEELSRDILIGRIPAERLEAIAQRVQTQRAAVDDPRLSEILDEIDLRAQVELAKWQRQS